MIAPTQEPMESPVVSGVTLDRNVARATLKGMPKKAAALTQLFETVARAGVNVDIIVHDQLENGSAQSVGFTFGAGDVDKVETTLTGLKDREAFAQTTFVVDSPLAKVSAVGLGMRSHSGVASKVFEALAEAGVDLLMISTSEIKIACVVPQTQAELATQALHKAFF